MPDGMQLPSPMPTLALAAAAATVFRVGTFVLASPLRPPALAAWWEPHSMSMLTGGRFEFGIGTGHAGNVRQAVEVLGMPETTAAQRLDQVERSIDRLRELDGDRHTSVQMLADGSGPLATVVADLPAGRNRMPPRAARDQPQRLARRHARRDLLLPRQRQVLSLTGPSSFAFTPPACWNRVSAGLPEPPSPARSGASSPTGPRPGCESRIALGNGSRPPCHRNHFHNHRSVARMG